MKKSTIFVMAAMAFCIAACVFDIGGKQVSVSQRDE
jgi:hypothetical protein